MLWLGDKGNGCLWENEGEGLHQSSTCPTPLSLWQSPYCYLCLWGLFCVVLFFAWFVHPFSPSPQHSYLLTAVSLFSVSMNLDPALLSPNYESNPHWPCHRNSKNNSVEETCQRSQCKTQPSHRLSQAKYLWTILSCRVNKGSHPIPSSMTLRVLHCHYVLK